MDSSKRTVLLVAPGSNLASCELFVGRGEWKNCEIDTIGTMNSPELAALEANIFQIEEKGYVAIVFDVSQLNLMDKLRVTSLIGHINSHFPKVVLITYGFVDQNFQDRLDEHRGFLVQTDFLDEIKRTVREILEKE